MIDESSLEVQLREVLGRAARRLDTTPPPWATVSSPSATEGRAPGRRRYRVRAGSLAVILAAGVSIAIAIVALISLHSDHGGSQLAGRPPVITPPQSPLAGLSQQQQNEVRADLLTAQQQTVRRDRGCRQSGALSSRAGKPASGSPAPATLAAFSILRRPGTRTDRAGIGPATTGLLKRLGPYVHYVRFLEQRAGLRYYIVPVRALGIALTTARCERHELNLMTHELARVPAAKRSALVVAAGQYLAYQRRLDAPSAGVCVTATGGCIRLSTLAFTGATVETSGEGDSNTTLLTAIVPDGPARITLDIPGGDSTPRGKTPRPLTITISVTHNLAIATLPDSYTELAVSPTRVIWRNRKGSILKVFERDRTDG